MFTVDVDGTGYSLDETDRSKVAKDVGVSTATPVANFNNFVTLGDVVEVNGSHVSISRRHPFHGEERIIQFSTETFEYEKYTGRIEREVTTRG